MANRGKSRKRRQQGGSKKWQPQTTTNVGTHNSHKAGYSTAEGRSHECNRRECTRLPTERTLSFRVPSLERSKNDLHASEPAS